MSVLSGVYTKYRL